MAGIDKGLECVDRAKAAGHREVARGLVTPGFVQGMFGYRQQFDVRVAHLDDIRNQALRHFSVGVKAAIWVPPPRAGVHFVDVDRGMQPIPAGALAHPLVVAPGILIGDDLRGRAGTQFVKTGIGIGLDEDFAGSAVADLVPVERPGINPGNEQLPYPAQPVRRHRVYAPVPTIEFTDYTQPRGVRRPAGKAHATDAIALLETATEYAIGLFLAAFIEQVQIVRADGGSKCVGIAGFEVPS